jgi:hypothetical protein
MKKYIRDLNVGDEVCQYHQSLPHKLCIVVSVTTFPKFSLQYEYKNRLHTEIVPHRIVFFNPKFDPMRVSDLIQILSNFDPDSIVVQTSSHINGGYTSNPTQCFVSDNMNYYNGGNLVVLEDVWEVNYHLEDYPNDNIYPAISF